MAKVIKSAEELNLPAYELKQEVALKDIPGQGFVFSHKKTGARICAISTDDNNKVFAIGFRTTPVDSTGVAHIIEHSVLCGSEKYPLKDPFTELCKSSLNTFLNALTYPDQTLYPASSCNETDFKNLMDVYLDAVLHPNIYKHKEIFLQEGWHYELESPEDELKLNGVVYSEMKGAFSSPEQVLSRCEMEAFLPDTTYGFSSGGDPDCIPDLTYEQFLDFHSKYYHPSNSYIYLYGDVDLQERLEYLDREYLSHFDRIDVDSEIKEQPEFGTIKEKTGYYNLGENDNDQNASYMSCCMTLGKSGDTELLTAFKILSRVLFTAPGAPVKQALMEAGIGQDITGYVDTIKQPFLSITATNADENRAQEFFDIIKAELKKLVDGGINKRSLLAALNVEEFSYREGDYGRYPKGLLRGMSLLSTWLYDDSVVFPYVCLGDVYTALREKIDSDYFEKLIDKYLLNSRHEAHVILMPKKGLLAEKEAALAKKLADYKNSLSDEEISKIVETTKELKAYQEELSTKEQIDTIPVLSLDDIEKKTTPIVNEICTLSGVETVFNPVSSSGIAYFSLLFDIGSIDEELIPYVKFLTVVLGSIDTEKYSYLELANEVNIHSGGMSAGIIMNGKVGDPTYYRPMVSVSGKLLYNEAGNIMELALEELLHSKLDDSKRIKELLAQTKARIQSVMNVAGSVFAMQRAKSYMSSGGRFNDMTNGIGFYRFVNAELESFDSRKEDFCAKLSEAAKMLFCRERLMINVGAEREGFAEIKPVLEKFAAGLPNGSPDFEKCGPKLEVKKQNEGFKCPGQVQFVACGGTYADKGLNYSGSLKVLSTILDMGFLWNNVRVQGGAYGVSSIWSDIDGCGFMVSYRDPRLKETLDVYKKTIDYVETFEADDDEMRRYIIGTMGGVDTPLTPDMSRMRSFGAYMNGQTTESLQKQRDEILSTDAAAIRALAPIVRATADGGYICVVGSETKICESGDIFMNVENYL